MWRDQYPAASQWVISSMRDVIEDLVGHLSAFKDSPIDRRGRRTDFGKCPEV
jgi:hypothetical protein